jgi:murein DD-endopeptidase MepM/ murein hydrolase activator NlpD
MGRWKVYQAFDGKWTHKGELRYAYDFVKSIEGKLFRGEGNLLQEYFSYAEPVVSPVEGWVVDLVNDVPDNIIGEVDRINIWGNYLLIRTSEGFYVLIAHLLQHSITVKVGEYVKKDQIVAKCGNSGYSPLPHIHVQVQRSPAVGSTTTPFVFEFFHKEGKLIFYDLPKEEEEIENLPVDSLKKMQLDFVLDDRFVYEVGTQEVVWRVKMNSRGEFYFDDGENRLYFYTRAKSFYFYDYEGGESLLKELYRAAPRIPLVNVKAKFTEPLPITLFKRAWFILGFAHKSYIRKVEYELTDKRVSSKFGEVELSPYRRGFALIKTPKVRAKLKGRRDDA